MYIQTIDYNPTGLDLAGEYVLLTNRGGTTANLVGWMLCDLAAHCYQFASFNLGPAASVQLWTKSGTDDATNLYWGLGNPIWNNDGDTATLRNAVNEVVDTYTY